MVTKNAPGAEDTLVDNAVAEGGAYEVIRKRLENQSSRLSDLTKALNEARLEEFGGSDMGVAGSIRVRTENNCTPRDIVQVGNYLMFGYNVFIGLKKETRVEDVFSLFAINPSTEGFDIEPVDHGGTFLAQSGFVNDFDELYRYYKHTRLVQMRVKDGKLLAGFQIGEKLEDIRVFRWSVSPDGKQVQYIDNRGERDIALPPEYDFEWIYTARENVVHGRHTHVNILDTVFVETLGGDLTIKVENNTEDGLGIYREAVEDKTQSIDDAQFAYAAVGQLILLKIRPYREEHWRYFIYNILSESVLRMDAIGQSCVQLPEDHGIIFPGGYYLQTGENKAFDQEVKGLKFKRVFRSPNGEDVLYIFYQPEHGINALFSYNLITKTLQNPIYSNGFALAEDGRLVIFNASAEPTRVHPMQIWKTPFQTDEFASKAPASQSFYGHIGNAELVRGISDLYSLCRMIGNQSVSSRLYEELNKAAASVFDDYYWIADIPGLAVGELLKEISQTAELVIDEYEKVKSIRLESAKAMAAAEESQQNILREVRPENWETAEEYVGALTRLRKQRGHLVTIRGLRYIDTGRIDKLAKIIEEMENTLSEQTVAFLSGEKALDPYLSNIEKLQKDIDTANTNADLAPLITAVEETAVGLDLLSELMGTLKVDDATVRTRVIDAISVVYARLNQLKAHGRNKQKNQGSEEAKAQFAAQFKLFSQSVTNALGLSTSPEKCDEQLSRLLVQLEEIESQFSQYDQFLTDIIDKREEVYESFEAHKQQLLDERQRRAQSLGDSASRILASIEKRSLKITDTDELNTYFATDTLVAKIRELAEQLRDIDAALKADDIEARFKALKDQAQRSLRDKTDIFEDGGKIIKLGPRHKFSVNTQELDLTIIPRGGALAIHLSGTEFFEPIAHPDLLGLRDYWETALESESPAVYRSEYLAAQVFDAANNLQDGLSLDKLKTALLDEQHLTNLVRDYAAPRYRDGYEKGIHDHDAAKILAVLVPALEQGDLLRFDPASRALAQVFWAHINSTSQGVTTYGDISNWQEQAQSALQLREILASPRAATLLKEQIANGIALFLERQPITADAVQVQQASVYLVEELGQNHYQQFGFIGSRYARELIAALHRKLNDETLRQLQQSLNNLKGNPAKAWHMAMAWFSALTEDASLKSLQRYVPEAAVLLFTGSALDRRETEADLEFAIDGLLGDHPLIDNGKLGFALDDFLLRIAHHQQVIIPSFQRYQQLRKQIMTQERDALAIDQFKARPLSSFVRNKLINDSYLPLIGDNLAKQMGTVGENKRTDLMGLLMMISPPGYGKTTLMEYVANRLGLIFMKINCPSLGHNVFSLDPAQAPNATARQELDKLNLGLEMGNNVMLYLDDIQHTHPEFLQKFISLCDGSRRIEGVWRGKTKTYDMRGKKFCVVMAGNPYTESGEVFKIPDMLANRADIYNLGDIIGGMDEQFALSYIENAITSNAVLAPLATRDMADIYTLIDMAKGKEVATTALKHQYNGAEVKEIVDVLRKMLVLQSIILKINRAYIASAAQDDKYRTEPPFKLQGSYRNMNKMTEKISAVMNERELQQLINDHYLGEAQLLTTGAEANLLKLAELRGVMSAEQSERWQKIKTDFLRNKSIGGDDTDVGSKIVAQLNDLVNSVHNVGKSFASPGDNSGSGDAGKAVASLNKTLEDVLGAFQTFQPSVNVTNEPVPGLNRILLILAKIIRNSILPLLKTMDKKLEADQDTQNKLAEISAQIDRFEDVIKAKDG